MLLAGPDYRLDLKYSGPEHRHGAAVPCLISKPCFVSQLQLEASHMAAQILFTHQPFPISSPNHSRNLNQSLPSLKITHQSKTSLRSNLFFAKKKEPRKRSPIHCFISNNTTAKSKDTHEKSFHGNPEDHEAHQQEDTKWSLSGIFTSMWWADLKAAFGQRFNLEGIICSARVIIRDHDLLLPQATAPDIRWIDWAELHRRGFKGVVFDKDNTITVPYVLSLWAPLEPSIEGCKSVFGEDNVAILSNSAGLYEFDPDGSKARSLEDATGIKVIRHKVKKPAGIADEIERHFNCPSKMLVMVGDRRFTDVVYGNRNGFLTILTEPLSDSEEPFVVKQVRKAEALLVRRWCRKGLKPISHILLPDAQAICVKEPPPSK
ncbi:hypothetical protein Dimus_000038 [Dionaea muscipula]